MAAWRIRLEGPAESVYALPRFLPSLCSLATEDAEPYLDSPLFMDSMKAEDLMAVGEQLLDAANLVAILLLPAWRPVTCDSAFRLREDGSALNVKLVSARISASATLQASPTVIRADGSIDPPTQPTRHNEEADIVTGNKPLRTALLLLRDGSWVNLYKAYEIVRDAVGGETMLRQLKWVSNSVLTRFTRTCQSPKVLGVEARHGVEVGSPPSNPMRLSEAKRLIADLICKWIELQLGEQRGSAP